MIKYKIICHGEISWKIFYVQIDEVYFWEIESQDAGISGIMGLFTKKKHESVGDKFSLLLSILFTTFWGLNSKIGGNISFLFLWITSVDFIFNIP